MDVFQAIYQRASVGKVKSDPLPQEVIEKLLAAAVQAPNHFKVRPWRFVVISGEARLRLGDVMAEILRAQKPDLPVEGLKAEHDKALRSPVIIAIGVDAPENPKVLEVENICAAAAAAQNMLLAAEAMGLASVWRTGPAAYNPAVKAFLGLQPEQHLIGFIYLGYAETERPPSERPGFEDRTTWLV